MRVEECLKHESGCVIWWSDITSILGLRSTDFDLEVKEGNLVVTTRGYGHGVKMSQYGAAGMAKEGYFFIDILKHYYTGISIY